MENRGIGMAIVVVIIVVVVAAAAGGYMILSSGGGTNGGGNGNGGNGEAATWTPYQFEEGVHYKYSLTSGDQSGNLTWDVTDVSGDQITVETGLTLDGQSYTYTFTGSKDTIYQKAMGTPAGAFLSTGFYGPWISYYTQEGLAVGNSWTVSSGGDTYSVEVTGKETYAGQESYVGEVRWNGELVYKSAVSVDLGFPTYVAIYDSDTGELDFEIVLQEYSS